MSTTPETRPPLLTLLWQLLRSNWVARWVFNRYALVLVAAAVWMLFFDKYDLRSQWEQRGKRATMQTDINFYRTEIQRLDYERELLRVNREEIERIAREKYLMKRDNEDLYIVVPAK
jgi:cell division protein FtsB